MDSISLGLSSLGRYVIVSFFLVAGTINLTGNGIREHIERMAGLGVPMPRLAFWFGITLQFTGCALLLLDVLPAVGAGLLIAFTVAATAIFHRFWQKPDPMMRRISMHFFLSNCALVGGLLLLLDR